MRWGAGKQWACVTCWRAWKKSVTPNPVSQFSVDKCLVFPATPELHYMEKHLQKMSKFWKKKKKSRKFWPAYVTHQSPNEATLTQCVTHCDSLSCTKTFSFHSQNRVPGTVHCGKVGLSNAGRCSSKGNLCRDLQPLKCQSPAPSSP